MMRSSLQAKGNKSTSFLTHMRKERSGLSTLGLRRCDEFCQNEGDEYSQIH